MTSKLIGNLKDFTSKWHYLKEEVDNKLKLKSDVGHTHSDNDVSVTTTNYGSGINQNEFNNYLSYDMINVKKDKADNDTVNTISDNVTNLQTDVTNLQTDVTNLQKPASWSTLISNTNFQWLIKQYNLKLNIHIPSAAYTAGKQKVIYTFDKTKYGDYLPPNMIITLTEYNYIIIILKSNQLIVENRRSSNWTGAINVSLYWSK